MDTRTGLIHQMLPGETEEGEDVSERWECVECNWQGPVGEQVNVIILRDDGTREVAGRMTLCPNCLAVNGSLIRLCDHEGCNLTATCGTPTSGGYALTCGRHAPEKT